MKNLTEHYNAMYPLAVQAIKQEKGPHMGTKVTKYGYRNWAVWLILEDGMEELIAVTIYKKGALRVKGLIDLLTDTRKEAES